MDTELLRILLIVAEEGSISGAAERLHFSQPAASKRLRTLEEALGEELFLRHNRGVELTEAGDRVLDFARSVVQLEDALLSDLEALKSPKPKTIEVVATQFVSASILSCLLWSFQQDQPHISVRITTAHAETAMRMVRNSAVPLALVEGPVDDADLTTQEIGHEPLVMVCTPELADQVSAGDPVPVLLPEEGTGIRRSVEEAIEHSELELHLNAAKRSDALHNLESMRVAALSGLGRVVVPRMVVQRELLQGDLVYCPSTAGEPLCQLPYGFVRRRERKLPPEYLGVIEHSAKCSTPIPTGKVRNGLVG